MLKSVHKQSKHQIVILSILITVIFLVINGALLLINRNSLNQKIEEENRAFVTIASHIIDDNPLPVVEEYILHYTHIHEVEVTFIDQNDTIIFESGLVDDNAIEYSIETTKGTYYFFIDNTNSVTVQLNELNLIIINSILLIIYITAMIVFIQINKRHANNMNEDLNHILSVIDENSYDNRFVYKEFNQIHQAIKHYLESIDLLHEQKEMVLKGLAHDIKTPLTVLYHYFDQLKKDKPLSKNALNQAFEAAKQINDYIERMINDQLEHKSKALELKPLVLKKLKDYEPILNQKSIRIKTHLVEGIFIKFIEQDFNRILDNLISNAYYYSKEESVLEVNLKKEDKVIIEIVSEPMAIKSLDIDHLFDKGYRASESSNPHGKGLGLYLSKLLIEHQLGTIDAIIEENNMKITMIL